LRRFNGALFMIFLPKLPFQDGDVVPGDLKHPLRILFTCALLGSALLLSDAGFGQPQTPNPDFPSFESFFQHSPTISKVVYEWQAPMGIAGTQRTNYYETRCDGSNFFESMLAPPENGHRAGEEKSYLAETGSFNNEPWDHLDGVLTLYQLGNDPDHDVAARMAARDSELSIARITDLGFLVIDRTQPMAWDSVKREFAVQAKTFSGQIYPATITLTYEGGIPISGILSNLSIGKSVIRVTYKYDNSFHNGLFPVEYTRYQKLGTNADFGPVATVRFLELDITNGPLPDEQINPRLLFNTKDTRGPSVVINSNDVAFALRRGNMLPLQTSEQAATERRRRQASEHSYLYLVIRVAIAAVFLIPPIIYISRYARKIKKQQPTTKRC
jgi:hypothetical protein